VAGREQCDDGNNKDGDGCSSMCRQETGFTCQQHFSEAKSAVVSMCASTETIAQKLMSKYNEHTRKCAKGDMVFVMTNIRDGEGACVDLKDRMARKPVGLQLDKAYVDGSSLSWPNKVYQRVEAARSCPKSNAKVGGAAVAVCQSASTKVCLGQGDDRTRTCKFQVKTDCKEVCVAPRYCKARSGVTHPTEMTGKSLVSFVRGVAWACRSSPDLTGRVYAKKYGGEKDASEGVKSLLNLFDKDKNGALSFSEFLAALQKKPFSNLLNQVPGGTLAQAKAIAAGKGNKDVRHLVQMLYDHYDIDGSLEQRKQFPEGKACCFKRCHTPKKWGVPRVSWCYKQHLKVSAGM